MLDPTHLAYVYRLFGDDGSLLYVGVTRDMCSRMQSHANSKEWWPEITSVVTEVFPNRSEADEAERVAIRDELPRYNLIGRPAEFQRAKRAHEREERRRQWRQGSGPSALQSAPTRSESTRVAARDAALLALAELGGWQTADDVAAAMHLPVKPVRRRLRAFTADGRAERSGAPWRPRYRALPLPQAPAPEPQVRPNQLPVTAAPRRMVSEQASLDYFVTVLASHPKGMRPIELQRVSGKSSGLVRMRLRQLADAGRVHRVRPGLWACTAPDDRPAGSSEAPADDEFDAPTDQPA